MFNAGLNGTGGKQGGVENIKSVREKKWNLRGGY